MSSSSQLADSITVEARAPGPAYAGAEDLGPPTSSASELFESITVEPRQAHNLYNETTKVAFSGGPATDTAVSQTLKSDKLEQVHESDDSDPPVPMARKRRQRLQILTSSEAPDSIYRTPYQEETRNSALEHKDLEPLQSSTSELLESITVGYRWTCGQTERKIGAKQQNNVEDLSVDSEYSDPPLPTGKKCRTLTSSPGYESEDSDAPLLPQKRWHSPSDNNGRKRQRKPLSNADFTEDGGALLSVESAKSRDKRRLIGRLTDQRRWLSKADIEQGVTRIIEPKTMAEVDASLPLTNMRRLHDILDGLEVRKRLPIAVTETEDTRFLWDEPRKDGQIWSQVPSSYSKGCMLSEAHKSHKGIRSWKLQLKDSGGTLMMFQLDSAYAERSAFETGQNLALLLERWPLPMPQTKGSRAQIVALAAARAVPNGDDGRVSFRSIGWEMWMGGGVERGSYFTQITFIDRKSGKYEEIRANVRPDLVNLSLNIPKIPSNVVFGDRLRGDSEKQCTPEGLDDTFQVQHEQAISVLKYVVWKLRDRTTTRTDLRAAIQNNVELYTKGATRFKTGRYGGKRLFTTKVSNLYRQISIRPSKAVEDDTSKPIPHIRIKGLSKSRILAVQEIMLRDWLQNGDLIKSWTVGCRAADAANDAQLSGETLSHLCYCDAYESQREIHACARCASMAICFELKWDPVVQGRVCSWCLEISGKTHGSQVHEHLKRLHRLEARAQGIGPEQISSEILDLWKSMKHVQLQGDDWQDIYTGTSRPDATRGLARSSHPFQPSPDAVFGFVRDRTDSKTRLHYEGNVAITALYLNYGKHIFVPGVLALIKEYRESSATKRGNLLKKFDDVYEICIKIPYLKSARLGTDITRAKMDGLMEEWVTTMPRKGGESKWQRTLWQYTSKPHKPPTQSWKPHGFGRIKRLVQDIEAYFGAVLPRATDGCPYPFDPQGMPADWSWWACYEFFGERTIRTWLWCNRRYVQVDTTETIFLECLWQFLDPSYQEFLDLPVVLWVRHPLRCALGHRQHGKQLRTGWITSQPSKIEHRDESLNNMLVETCTSNYMKHNFPTDMYPAMLQDFQKLKIRPEHYNPDGTTHAFPNTVADDDDFNDWKELRDDMFDDMDESDGAEDDQ